MVVVSRTDEAGSGGPIAHGRTAFYDALSEAGAGVRTVDHWTEADRDTCVVGTTPSRPVARLLDDVEEGSPSEGVVYRWCETEVSRQ